MIELAGKNVCIENFLGIEGFDIYWYGVLIAIGFLFAYVLCTLQSKKRKFPADLTTDILIVAIICACIGARLYYVVFEWKSYYVAGDVGETLRRIVDIRAGGLAIYGGVFAAILGIFFYTKIKKYNFVQILDLCAAPLAIGQAIGRWGNYFNQEAHGGLVENPSLCFFPYAVYLDSPKDADAAGWYQATFFYESVWCLIIFAVLLAAFKKQKYRGQLVYIYFSMYGFERGIVEWLRTDQLKIFGLPVSALLSIALCVASIIMLVVLGKRKYVTPLEYEMPAAAQSDSAT